VAAPRPQDDARLALELGSLPSTGLLVEPNLISDRLPRARFVRSFEGHGLCLSLTSHSLPAPPAARALNARKASPPSSTPAASSAQRSSAPVAGSPDESPLPPAPPPVDVEASTAVAPGAERATTFLRAKGLG